jgi:hypothetical protein
LSSFINRVTAVRLVILFAVAAVSFSAVQVVRPSSSPTHGARAVPVAPIEQPVEAGIITGPAATPPSAPATAKVARDKRRTRHATSRARPGNKRHAGHRANRKAHQKAQRKGHHRAHRKARHAHATRHHAHRPHRAHNHWRHAGGRDISWPQCPTNVGFGGRNGLGQPMPDPGVGFVVVGLTNGRAFTPNPCLGEHLAWVRNHVAAAAAYAFAAFPSRAQLRRHRNHGPYDGRTGFGALKNSGHAAARYNIRVMRQHGFTTPHVWLDVEPSSSHPWSHRRQLNRAVVRGWIRGYRDAGYTVGVYSTPLLWRHILGGFRPGLPEWRTAGPASPGAALAKCRGESIQGGPAVIAQWWTSSRDFDRLCPSAERRTTMATYFHQW